MTELTEKENEPQHSPDAQQTPGTGGPSLQETKLCRSEGWLLHEPKGDSTFGVRTGRSGGEKGEGGPTRI
ncbi:UNVERIFIED_CONTAM: hypothetical protein K2H54_012614 [Gekko kuhli]